MTQLVDNREGNKNGDLRRRETMNSSDRDSSNTNGVPKENFPFGTIFIRGRTKRRNIEVADRSDEDIK